MFTIYGDMPNSLRSIKRAGREKRISQSCMMKEISWHLKQTCTVTWKKMAPQNPQLEVFLEHKHCLGHCTLEYFPQKTEIYRKKFLNAFEKESFL
jgi:hypothetical protein